MKGVKHWIARADVARYLIDLAEVKEENKQFIRKVVAITTEKPE